MHRTHVEDHTMGRTLQNLISKKHGSSVSGWACKMCMDACSTCVFKRRKRTRVAGLRPILTKNFGTRGQIDLIDYSATPDGPCKCLLTYCDHGIKIANARPLTTKHLMAVASALQSMFGVTGSPDILQSDNGGEFANIAQSSKTMHFTQEELQLIITYCHEIWPGVKQVTGTPRHSPSNGGIENFNKTMEGKVNNWILEMNSTAWVVGCFYVAWRINTEIVRSLRNRSPYELLTGQKPNQGLSTLPMHPQLLANHQSDSHLQSALNLPANLAIEDALVNEDSLVPVGENVAISQENE